MSQLVVDNDLLPDAQGAIKTFLSDATDGKRALVELWFATELGGVPFLNFGNNLLQQIFQTMNDGEIQARLDAVVQNFKTSFGLDVISESRDVDKDNKKISISLTLQNNYNLVLKL